jgi:RNA polymerase-binding transcription factor DksA
MATKKKAVKAKKAVSKPAAKKASNKKATKPLKKTASKKAPAKKKAAPAKSAVKKATPKKAVKSVKKSTPSKSGMKSVSAKPAAKVIKPLAAKSVMKVPAKPVQQVKPAIPAPASKELSKTMTTKKTTNGSEKSRYSDNELKEFKELIMRKLDDARSELINLNAAIISANENGTDDTGASFKMLEDGSDTLAKEEAAQLAARQKKFIEQLEAALVRIENKTYGICRVTGKLIPKERLRAVPHTTQSMEAKLQQYKD